MPKRASHTSSSKSFNRDSYTLCLVGTCSLEDQVVETLFASGHNRERKDLFTNGRQEICLSFQTAGNMPLFSNGRKYALYVTNGRKFALAGRLTGRKSRVTIVGMYRGISGRWVNTRLLYIPALSSPLLLPGGAFKIYFREGEKMGDMDLSFFVGGSLFCIFDEKERKGHFSIVRGEKSAH